MNNFTNNNIFINRTSLKSGQLMRLNETINILNNLNMKSNYLNTKSNEIGKIINNKNTSADLIAETNLIKTSKAYSSNLLNLLLANIKGQTFDQANLNKGNFFGIGNKYISLNTFRNILHNLNLRANGTETNETTGKNNLRQYLNLITNFETKNSSYAFYQFNKANKYLFAMRKAAKFLNLSFNSKGCLISKPTFNLIYTNNKIENEINFNLNKNINKAKIIVNLFYFIKTADLGYNNLTITENNAKVSTDLFERKFSNLTDYLTRLFNTEVELNIVRLYQPYQDSNILVQYLNSESYTNKFIKLSSRVFKNINLNNNQKSDYLSELDSITTDKNNYFSYPSSVTGLNIKLAGRAVNERIIPRLTVKRAQRGSFNRLNAKLIEKSMFTDKTRKGAYSFTVTLSQNFK